MASWHETRKAVRNADVLDLDSRVSRLPIRPESASEGEARRHDRADAPEPQRGSQEPQEPPEAEREAAPESAALRASWRASEGVSGEALEL